MSSLYDTIFTRRSVRQYEAEPLSTEELTEIQTVLANAKQLAGQKARFELAGAEHLKGVASPHAILAYSEDTEAALCNIGYTLQELDLWLQARRLGSLWMGMGKPTEQADAFRILLAFGKSSVPARGGSGDFKRKPLSQISNEDNPIARAARLAPSAVNFQPWKLDFEPGKLSIRHSPTGLARFLALNFQKIDLGICTRHAALALEHEGKTVTEIRTQGSGKQFCVEILYQ